MSNNKTVVPGMENPYGFGDPSNQGGVPQQGPVYKGTHFPGMDANPNKPMQTDATHKPIMGFLFSVSRTSVGEYWPLYMGLNTIGRAMNSSVRMSEATISDNHAEIVIRQMKNPDTVLVSIQDARSTCGTLLNGSSLGFEAQECHNGDIITIGEHYELFLILVDTKSLGLAVRSDFIPVGPAAGNAQMPATGVMGSVGNPMPYGQPQSSYYTQTPGNPMGTGPRQQSTSTVIMPGLKK